MSSGSCHGVSPTRKWAAFVVHCRDKFHYDVYIGRGSIWGNPFTHLPLARTKAEFHVESREESILSYRRWILTQPHLLAQLPKLKGKKLGCYCSPKECHGEVLAEFANDPDVLRIELAGLRAQADVKPERTNET